MGYYIRLLTPNEEVVDLSDIETHLLQEGKKASLELLVGGQKNWEEVSVSEKGAEIFVIERNPVQPGSLGAELLEEFLEEIEDCKPKSAIPWLKEYFKVVRAVYSFQILNSIYEGNGWEIFDVIREYLWERLNGIIQADSEGFTNLQGCHILWQFSEDAEGEWNMGVLDVSGEWIHFRMDLANPDHRNAFLEGRVPNGAERLE